MGAILIDDEAQLKDWQEAPLLVATLHTRDVPPYLPDLLLTPASLVPFDFLVFYSSNKRAISNLFFLRSLEPARGYPYTTLAMGSSDRHGRNCQVINVAPFISCPFEAQWQLYVPPALSLRRLLFLLRVGLLHPTPTSNIYICP